MIAVQYDRGIFLPAEGLWLDPHGQRDFAFISHAHSDHTGRHAEVILTEATARLMHAREGHNGGKEHILGWRERRFFSGFEAMLIPAGHVLGSAQCYLETDSGSLLYTGDFKLRSGLSSERAEAEPAETLIMETTFGRPHYVFPPAERVIADIVRFCREGVEDGEVPVLLGYSLGKAQEILAALGAARLPIMLHGSVWKLTRIYSEMGVGFPEFRKYEAGEVDGHVLICPPSVSGSAMIRRIPRRRVAMMTGWAMDPGARFRYQVDAAFPLSDHADYTDLLRHVEAVGPKRVLTLHGFADDFARDLRERGIEAWSLTGGNQLSLSLDTGRSAAVVSVGDLPEADPSEPRQGFDRFCSVTEAIADSTGKLAKVEILSAYLRELDDDEMVTVARWFTGSVIGQANGKPLQLGWAVIRRALLDATKIPPGEFSAISRRWNDAGETAGEVMARGLGASAKSSGASIGNMSGLLEQLAETRGPIAKAARLKDWLLLAKPAEARGLVKILTGDLRIGLKEGLVEDAVSQAFEADPDAVREAHMLLGDLGETAILARNGRLAEAGLRYFCPIKCMLASPEPDADGVWKRLGESGSVWLEDKLDGIRAQLHVAQGRCRIYSRDLKDITATFGEIVEAAEAMGIDAVLDGEILAYENGRPLSFFELQRRLGRRDRDLFLASDVPVTFSAFDLLAVGHQSIFREPLVERRRLLEALPFAQPLTVSPRSTAASPAEIDSAFDRARGAGNEGLIAKDPSSRYQPGRRGFWWIKLKREFATLDCVIVGAEYGHGKRAGVLSDYTFAVRDDSSDRLLTIGKAYSGLTDVEIAGLTTELLATVRAERGRVLEVEPRIVLEIAFDSIRESDRHSSGLAMRFPRIKTIRRDKTARDIDTLSVARKLIRR